MLCHIGADSHWIGPFQLESRAGLQIEYPWKRLARDLSSVFNPGPDSTWVGPIQVKSHSPKHPSRRSVRSRPHVPCSSNHSGHVWASRVRFGYVQTHYKGSRTWTQSSINREPLLTAMSPSTTLASSPYTGPNGNSDISPHYSLRISIASTQGC